jgi:hypothetical protein
MSFSTNQGMTVLTAPFFEVRTVVDIKAVAELKEIVEAQGAYQFTSNIPVDTILKKFEFASHALDNVSNTFEGVDDSHIERNEVKQLSDWITNPIKPEQKPIALLVGECGLWQVSYPKGFVWTIDV